jgi:hypothetical protein
MATNTDFMDEFESNGNRFNFLKAIITSKDFKNRFNVIIEPINCTNDNDMYCQKISIGGMDDFEFREEERDREREDLLKKFKHSREDKRNPENIERITFLLTADQ